MIGRTMACATLLAWAGAASAEVIHVSPDASDSIAPLQAAVDRARPGDTVVVGDGRYRGSLSLSGLRGEPDGRITIRAATPHGAVIVGSTKSAAIGAWGVSNVTVEGLHVVSQAMDGDEGGFKLAGPWDDPARGVVLSNNLVTGSGQDGIKFYNGARDNVVSGNTIDGTWRQEAMDNVSVERMRFLNNTVRGSARWSGLTYKAGSRNIEVRGNDFDIDAPLQVSVGGMGNSRLEREFPDYWKGFEASDTLVTGNTIAGTVRVISAIDNRIEGNNITGRIETGTNDMLPDSVASSGNVITDNGTPQANTGSGVGGYDGHVLPGGSRPRRSTTKRCGIGSGRGAGMAAAWAAAWAAS